MNDFRKDFREMRGGFADRTGHESRDENVYWAPIVVTRREIDAEVERLANLPAPANGRRESLIVHPSPKRTRRDSRRASGEDPVPSPGRNRGVPPQRHRGEFLHPRLGHTLSRASVSPSRSTTSGTIPRTPLIGMSTTARTSKSA
jgi:hypothetical protein